MAKRKKWVRSASGGMTAVMEDTQAKLTDAIRDFLTGWPPGATRKIDRFQWEKIAEDAVELGYLEDRSVTHAYRDTEHKYRRTNKELPPLKFAKPPKGCPWPWTAREHWYLILTSPAHTQRQLLQEMLRERGDAADSRKDYRSFWSAQHKLVMDLPTPDTRNELGTLRRHIEGFLGIKKDEDDYLTLAARKKLGDPMQAIKTMIALMVKPVVRDGIFTGVTAMSAEQQLDTIARLVAHEERNDYARRIGRLVTEIGLS
jgi:hypothetical protein